MKLWINNSTAVHLNRLFVVFCGNLSSCSSFEIMFIYNSWSGPLCCNFLDYKPLLFSHTLNLAAKTMMQLIYRFLILVGSANATQTGRRDNLLTKMLDWQCLWTVILYIMHTPSSGKTQEKKHMMQEDEDSDHWHFW